ncbi:MAG: glycosyltransferase [Spirochaetes bacterium]|nr:glycosyltransferase [Spirochaetota bacterium]
MHIVRSLEIGGMENGIVNVFNNIDGDFFELSICCLKKEGALRQRLDKKVKVICLQEEEGFDWRRVFVMAKLFIKEKPHIVHTHGWGSGFFPGVIGAKLAKVPVIIESKHGFWRENQKRRIIAQRALSFLTDKITTVSKDLKNSIVSCFGISQEKIMTIINGVDIKKFKPDMNIREIKRKELNLQKNDFVIGTVGRLVSLKDHKTLLYAAEKLIKTHLAIKFILIGDGPMRAELESLANTLRINDRVQFLGERTDVPDLLNAMDLFILTSLSEGLSNTILEAMSTGIAIVATKVGGNSEIVVDGKTGILIPSGDPKNTAQVICELFLNRVLTKQMGQAARRYVEEKFSLEGMVKGYEGLYKDFLKKKGLI